MRELLFREPARITALVAAILAVLVAFGVQVTLEQTDSLIQLIATAVGILAIVLGGNEITRAKVTPIADPRLNVGTPVNGGSAEVMPTARGSSYRGEGA